MSTNPSGLIGVGDMFNPPSGGFQENMGMSNLTNPPPPRMPVGVDEVANVEPGYYSPVMSSPGTALDNLNEEIANFDLASFGGPLPGDGLFESPMPSPGQASPFPFNNNHNPFTSPPESFIPPRTASPLPHGLPEQQTGNMDSFIRTPQPSPSRHPFRDSIISTPDLSSTHHNPLKESLLQARQPSPSRESFMEPHIRTPEASPTRHSFTHQNLTHQNLMNSAPDLRPTMTPRGSASPTRSRQSPSPSRRMRAHQRTQSLASVNSVMSLADGDMEQYRVESNVKPEQISELIGESDAPGPVASDATPASSSSAPGQPPSADSNKKFICKWIEPNKETGEDKVCGQFFERKENCKAHIQTHLDDRQYKCPYGFCGKLFVRSHDLRRHLRTHDVHKKWVCPCGRDFSRADALHRHQGRGNCIGAPPGTKRKEPAKRGRPPKKKDVVASSDAGGDNGGSNGNNLPCDAISPADLNKPPEPQSDIGGNHNAANSAAFGQHMDGGLDGNDFRRGGFVDDDDDMMGMGDMGPMPDFATDPSPSPGRDGTTPNSTAGGLIPSPLGDELSSSPMPTCDSDHLLEPTGDDWLEDLIFINDDNFVDTGAV